MRVAEGVYTDDGVRAVVLFVFVEHRLFLNFAALIAGFHRAEHAAALADGFQFFEYGVFNPVGEFVDNECALIGSFAFW